MNDKIKEIVKEIECYRNEELCLIFLSREESNALLDYISNLENYKSRCEKINEILKESPDFNYSNDYIILKRRIESVLQGENNE